MRRNRPCPKNQLLFVLLCCLLPHSVCRTTKPGRTYVSYTYIHVPMVLYAHGPCLPMAHGYLYVVPLSATRNLLNQFYLLIFNVGLVYSTQRPVSLRGRMATSMCCRWQTWQTQRRATPAWKRSNTLGLIISSSSGFGQGFNGKLAMVCIYNRCMHAFMHKAR